jgi:hypothetical protein
MTALAMPPSHAASPGDSHGAGDDRDDDGQTKVTYYAPGTLAARYGLGADLAARLAGIDPLTDALVAGS